MGLKSVSLHVSVVGSCGLKSSWHSKLDMKSVVATSSLVRDLVFDGT